MVRTEHLRALASLRLTVFLLVVLGACSLAGLYWPAVRGAATAAALALLAVNLLAAIVWGPALRRFRALLVFHLALLVLVVLAAASALTSMYGTGEVSEGQAFDRHLLFEAAGPWHPQKAGQLRFLLERADFGFHPDRSVRSLSASLIVSEPGDDLRRQPLSIQQPVRLAGVRIYPAPARGFAVVMTWWPRGGPAPSTGALHFPPQPSDPYAQAVEWTPPQARGALWLQLDPDAIAAAGRSADGRLAPDAELIIRDGYGARHALTVGDSATLPEGQLRFERVGWWIGLSFHYDWTIPWLLGASCLAVLSLGAHFWSKYRRVSWDA